MIERNYLTDVLPLYFIRFLPPSTPPLLFTSAIPSYSHYIVLVTFQVVALHFACSDCLTVFMPPFGLRA